MKTVRSTLFAVLLCFTGTQRVMAAPVSVAPHDNDSGAVIDSLAAFNPAEDTAAVDTEYAPRTTAPLFLPEDSLFKDEKEAGQVDSTRVSAQTDTAGTVAAADTLGHRPDSGALRLHDTVHFYPGISAEQHALARRMLDCFYNADWDSSDIAAKNLQKLEKEQQLPPLSALLMVGVRVLRVLHGEYENDRVKKALRRDVQQNRCQRTGARGP